jgi:hypothetical protein
MSIQKTAHVAFGVAIHHTEKEVLDKIIEELYFDYDEEQIEEFAELGQLPAVDAFHEDVDEIKLKEKFPDIDFDLSGNLVMDSNLGLVFFVHSSFIPLDVDEDNQKATRLTPELIDEESLKQIKEFAKHYGTAEPSWIAWTNAF